jgi:replicative superfamily II helicase
MLSQLPNLQSGTALPFVILPVLLYDRLRASPSSALPCQRQVVHEQIQSDCFREAFCSDMNMVVSSPTGSGKTVILELAILRMLRQHISPTGADY